LPDNSIQLRAAVGFARQYRRSLEFVIPAKAGIVRLRACMVSEVRVLVRHALSGL
jgi:hypothetical protein